MDPGKPGSDQVKTRREGGLVITEDPRDKGKSKEFAFTLFNEMAGEDLVQVLELKCKKFAFQREQCPETKKIHFQGQMSLHEREDLETVWKWFPKPGRVRRTRNVTGSELYCQKGETRIEGPWTKGEVAKLSVGGRPKKAHGKPLHPQTFVSKFETVLRQEPSTWYPWQVECMKIAGGRPDERNVWWWWGPDGCSGKTTMIHKLSDDYEAQVIGGKYQNVLACATDAPRRLYVVAAGRKTKPEKFPYEAIEALKDGTWLKEKYEVVPVIRKSLVHVFVFANCAPILDNFTKDRWRVIKIDGGASAE